MKTEIFKTYRDFLNREDKTLNGVSPEFAKKHPDYEKQNETNRGCWNCSDCSDCSNEKREASKVPTVGDLDKKLYASQRNSSIEKAQGEILTPRGSSTRTKTRSKICEN